MLRAPRQRPRLTVLPSARLARRRQKDAVGLGLEQETRARLASMPEKERRDAVACAFSGGGAARTRDAGRDGPPIAQPLLAPSACQPYCG